MPVKFMPNAVVLYREGGEVPVEGKLVEYELFDKDDLVAFEEARADGWKTYGELFTDAPKTAKKKGA
jgi:hypothetical protein